MNWGGGGFVGRKINFYSTFNCGLVNLFYVTTKIEEGQSANSFRLYKW